MTCALAVDLAPTRRRRADLVPTLALVDQSRPVGRPRGQLGDVALALLDAMDRLATPTRAPTLLELSHAAQVGRVAAKATLANLVRSGLVASVRPRWVAYSRKPVSEYARVSAAEQATEAQRAEGAQHLAQAMQAMAR